MSTRDRHIAGAIAAIVVILLSGAIIAAATVRPGLSILERAALVGTFISPFLIVGSAALVFLQIREAANTVRAQLFDATAGRMLNLSHVLVEYPDIRPYLYEYKDVDDQPERVRSQALAAAEMHLDFFDTELLRSREFKDALRNLPSARPLDKGHVSQQPSDVPPHARRRTTPGRLVRRDP